MNGCSMTVHAVKLILCMMQL